MPIVQRDADLDRHPKVLEHSHTHVAVGDLHGNALKLIYVMIEEGVLKLSNEQEYEQLRDIYNKGVEELTKEDLDGFKEIIESATVSSDRVVTFSTSEKIKQ